MSSHSDVAIHNSGLFASHLVGEFVTSDHRSTAKRIKDHFANAKDHNPYKISRKKLSSLSESDTEEYYIKPVLKILGYVFRKDHCDSNRKFPDFWLLNDEPEATDAEYLQRNNVTIVEAKAYSVDLDLGDGREELPPDQVAKYIQSNVTFNPHKRWGILTNGYKWRLYSDEGTDKYFEIDLDHALESEEELEKFCAIFSPKSFKVNRSRKSTLDNVREQSLASWTQVTKLIEDRANELLLELISGFFAEGNSLKQSKTLAYDFLYKSFFILYVESKKIIPVQGSAYGPVSLSQLLFDLDRIDFDEYEIADRLTALFEIYEHGNEYLNANFGGEAFEANTTIRVKNSYLKSALNLLTVFERGKSVTKFYDFSSLNVEVLGDVYESTLKAEHVARGKKVKLVSHDNLTGTEAHSTGTTYTPSGCVKYLVEEALDCLPKSKIAACDPACGSGHFLVECLRQLSKRIPLETTGMDSHIDHKRAILKDCIFGNDTNELAAKLCRLVLSIETIKKGEPSIDLRRNVQNFDSVLADFQNGEWAGRFGRSSFDLIVGNPPYVRADEPGQKDYRAEIKNSGNYQWLHKKWDFFIPFIELGVSLIKESKGVVAFVVGEGITYAPYAKVCVEELSKSGHVKFVSHFSKPFRGWAFPGTCFVFDCGRTYTSEKRIHQGNSPDVITSIETSSNPFLAGRKSKVKDIRDSWDHLLLGEISYVSVGMVLNMHEKLKGQGNEFEKADLISTQDSPDQTHPVRYLDNDDLGMLSILDRKKRHIEYGPGLRAPSLVRRPTFPELHEGKRILLASSKKGRAVATVSETIIVSHNTFVIKRWCDLKGIENRSITKRIKELAKKRGITDIVSYRKRLEEISEEISYSYLAGILASNMYIQWAIADKRHKHNVVPDVVSELPMIPLTEFDPPKSRQYGLSFSNTLVKLEKDSSPSAIADCMGHIEALVEEIQECGSNESASLINYLDAVVELLYRKHGIEMSELAA